MSKFLPSLQTLEQRHRVLAILLFFALGSIVLAALGFQYVGGQIPCKLCLEQRVPYYISVPIMLGVACFIKHLPPLIVRLLFFLVAGVMLYNFGLGVYHAGAEWQFWQGPIDCASAAGILVEDVGDLLGSLNNALPVSCTQASFYFLGLSMAGWNAVASLLGAVVAAMGALMRRPKLA